MTTYIFEPPTTRQTPVVDMARPDNRANRLMRHFRTQPAGRSVLKIGGVYATYDSPEASLVASATEAYIGGHRYEVSASVAAALEAAGYDVTGYP